MMDFNSQVPSSLYFISTNIREYRITNPTKTQRSSEGEMEKRGYQRPHIFTPFLSCHLHHRHMHHGEEKPQKRSSQFQRIEHHIGSRKVNIVLPHRD